MKEAIAVGDLPSACRTWDNKRRVWVAKTKYGTEAEADRAAGRGMRAYRCNAKRSEPHFHVGHANRR
jgi:hypothetical protein